MGLGLFSEESKSLLGGDGQGAQDDNLRGAQEDELRGAQDDELRGAQRSMMAGRTGR